MLWGEWKPKENHFPQKSCRTHLFSSAESYGVSVQLSSGIIRSSSEVWFWSGDSMEQLPGRQVSTWRVLQGSGGFMGWLLDSLPGASKRSRTRRILGGFWEGLRGLSRAPQCWLGGMGRLLEWVPKKLQVVHSRRVLGFPKSCGCCCWRCHRLIGDSFLVLEANGNQFSEVELGL